MGGINWQPYLLKVLEVILDSGLKLLYQLIERWAEKQTEAGAKPTSEEKKAKFVEVAKVLEVPLADDELDAAVEAVHLETERLAMAEVKRVNRIGKAARTTVT